MVQRWKEINVNPKITLAEMRNEPVKKYVKKKERWCNHCNNCETLIRNKKKLSTIWFNKGFVQKVFRFLKEKQLKIFTIKQLIDEMNIKDLSNGSLQRSALAILSVLGYVKIDFQEYKDKKGENKFKLVYLYRESLGILPSKCYDKINDSHIDILENWRETEYFNDDSKRG